MIPFRLDIYASKRLIMIKAKDTGGQIWVKTEKYHRECYCREVLCYSNITTNSFFVAGPPTFNLLPRMALSDYVGFGNTYSMSECLQACVQHTSSKFFICQTRSVKEWQVMAENLNTILRIDNCTNYSSSAGLLRMVMPSRFSVFNCFCFNCCHIADFSVRIKNQH